MFKVLNSLFYCDKTECVKKFVFVLYFINLRFKHIKVIKHVIINFFQRHLKYYEIAL